MRRKLPLAVVAPLAPLALAGAASPATAASRRVEPASPNAEADPDATGDLALHRRDLRAGRGPLVYVRRPLPRPRPRARRRGPQIHGSTRLELIWTVVPVVILAAIGAFVFYKLPGIRTAERERRRRRTHRRPGRGPPVLLAVHVPERRRSRSTARAPVGRNVELDVTAPATTSSTSWWIPALGGKIDAIPGKTNHTGSRRRDRRSTGPVRRGLRRPARADAAERRGVPHARVRALARRSAARRTAGTSDLGKETFDGVCAKCHGSRARARSGPTLARQPLLARPRRGSDSSSANGRGAMPPVGGTGATRQIDALTRTTLERRELQWRLSQPHAYPPPGTRGRFASWLVDRRPQADRDPLHRARRWLFFVAGGDHGAADPHAARAGRTSTSSRATPTTSSSRCTGRR